MDGLTKLLAPLHSGKPLLDALKSSQLSDSILPGLIAEVVTEARASGNKAGPTAAPIPTPGTNSAQETALSSIDQLSFVNPRCSGCAYRRGLARKLVPAGKPLFVTLKCALPNTPPDHASCLCRGRHDLRFGQTSFTVSSAKTSLTVPYAAITNLLVRAWMSYLLRWPRLAWPCEADAHLAT